MKEYFDTHDNQIDVFVREAHDVSGLSDLRNFVRANVVELGQYGVKLLVAMYTSPYSFSYAYKPTAEDARVV